MVKKRMPISFADEAVVYLEREGLVPDEGDIAYRTRLRNSLNLLMEEVWNAARETQPCN